MAKTETSDLTPAQKQIFRHGLEAGKRGQPHYDNPYAKSDFAYELWADGHRQGRKIGHFGGTDFPRPVKKNPRDDEPAYIIENIIDSTSLAKVCDMLAGICGQKADHIESNWQDRALARRWQNASNKLHTMSEHFRKQRL